MLDAGAQPVGDPHAVPLRGGRRARAEVRRRHRHAARLRAARHRRQHARPSASTTRARTSGRSATRSGDGSSRSSRIRSRIRSSTRRRSAASCRRCFRRSAAQLDPRARARCSSLPPDALDRDGRRVQRARCARARSTTRCSTTAAPKGLTPNKTHWARPLDTPPFYGYPLRPGITFTYLGLKVDERARVADGERRAGGEHVRGRRDHGGQHPRPGLRRRRRHDDRHGVRAHRGQRRPAPRMPSPDADSTQGAARDGRLQRLPLLRRRTARCSRRWSNGSRSRKDDLAYLANLCHNCGECLYACQYAPPHEFGINVPRTLAELAARIVRGVLLARGAWPARSGTTAPRRARHWPLARRAVLLALALMSGAAFWPAQAGRRFLRSRPARRDGGALRPGRRFATLALSIGFVGQPVIRSVRLQSDVRSSG